MVQRLWEAMAGYFIGMNFNTNIISNYDKCKYPGPFFMIDIIYKQNNISLSKIMTGQIAKHFYITCAFPAFSDTGIIIVAL
jgi:hypothetical protein